MRHFNRITKTILGALVSAGIASTALVNPASAQISPTPISPTVTISTIPPTTISASIANQLTVVYQPNVPVQIAYWCRAETVGKILIARMATSATTYNRYKPFPGDPIPIFAATAYRCENYNGGVASRPLPGFSVDFQIHGIQELLYAKATTDASGVATTANATYLAPVKWDEALGGVYSVRAERLDLGLQSSAVTVTVTSPDANPSTPWCTPQTFGQSQLSLYLTDLDRQSTYDITVFVYARICADIGWPGAPRKWAGVRTLFLDPSGTTKLKIEVVSPLYKDLGYPALGAKHANAFSNLAPGSYQVRATLQPGTFDGYSYVGSSAEKTLQILN
jgi:hypothetical protein